MKIYLNCDDNPYTWNKKQYLLAAANRLGLTYVFDFKDRTEPTQEYILNIEPCTFYTGTRWTGIWEIDLLCNRPETGRDWSNADSVFIAGSHYAPHLDQAKPRLLFQACDPTFYRPDVKKEYDFVITGSMGYPLYGGRSQAIDLLKQKYSYADFGKDKPPHTYIEHISKAKVQFIHSMESSINKGEVAQRFFECLAIGPVLTNYVDDLYLLGLIEGKDYLHYQSPQEMIAKFDMLLHDQLYAANMAHNGRCKALELHTYEHRLITILNTIHEAGKPQH